MRGWPRDDKPPIWRVSACPKHVWLEGWCVTVGAAKSDERPDQVINAQAAWIFSLGVGRVEPAPHADGENGGRPDRKPNEGAPYLTANRNYDPRGIGHHPPFTLHAKYDVWNRPKFILKNTGYATAFVSVNSVTTLLKAKRITNYIKINVMCNNNSFINT